MKEKKVTITVRMDNQEVERNFQWNINQEDWCDVGLLVEDMLKSIENSYKHNW